MTCCVQNVVPSHYVGDATLHLSVPEDAVVFINGRRTFSVGTARTYVSKGLRKGWAYKNVVRVVVQCADETIENTKTILLRPDHEDTVAFDYADRGNLRYVSVRKSAPKASRQLTPEIRTSKVDGGSVVKPNGVVIPDTPR